MGRDPVYSNVPATGPFTFDRVDLLIVQFYSKWHRMLKEKSKLACKPKAFSSAHARAMDIMRTFTSFIPKQKTEVRKDSLWINEIPQRYLLSLIQFPELI